MGQKIQVRRGSAIDRAATTFDNGEPVWDTVNKRLFMGDGVTQGGVDIAPPVISFKNKIINGNFDVWQRGVSFGNNVYTADRFATGNVGSSTVATQQLFTIGQTLVPFNPKYFLRNVITSVAGAGNISYISQKIESVYTFAGQTITLSFWAKSDASRPMAFEFEQQMGTGGSPSGPVNGFAVGKVNLTTTWQKFTFTATMPSISGKVLGTNNNDNLNLNFYFDAGANFNPRTNSLGQQSGTFDIAQIQVEAGAVATDFEQRPYAMEYVLCLRYCPAYRSSSGLSVIGFGQAASATQATPFIPFHIPARAPPASLVISNGAHFAVSQASTLNTNCTSVTFGSASQEGAVVVTSGSSGLVAGNASIFFFNTSAGFLYFEGSEL